MPDPHAAPRPTSPRRGRRPPAGAGRTSLRPAVASVALAALLSVPALAAEAPATAGGDPAARRGDGASGVAPRGTGAAAKAAGLRLRRVPLGPLDRAALLAEDAARARRDPNPPVTRTGVRRRFPRVAAPRRLGPGTRGVTTLADGTRVWTAEFAAPGAEGIRLRLAAFDLPQGAEAVLYDADDPRESYGPFVGAGPRGTGAFHAPTVFSDRVRLEVSLPPGAAEPVEVAVDSALLRYAALGAPAAVGKSASFAPLAATNCHVDVACEPSWMWLASAVARVELTNGTSLTGCLVSDTDYLSTIPWFLTSAQGTGMGAAAGEAEFYWNDLSAECGGVPPDPATLPRTIGATPSVVSDLTDVALLRLAGTIPAGRVYAGWTTEVPGTSAAVASLHHAGGARMGIVLGATYSPEIAYHQAYWTSGALADGAAGAPLFDGQQRLVGQLASIASTCGGADGPDAFGRIDGAWADLQPFLDPSGTVDPPDPEPLPKLFWNIWNISYLEAGASRQWEGDILEYSTYTRPDALIRVTLRGRRGASVELRSPDGETWTFKRRGKIARPAWGTWTVTLHARATGRPGKYRVKLRKNV